MAYVPVPKDLTKVKTKVMFNLTRRQLVCFTAGALVGVPLFLWLREPAGNSMAAMCMMLVMMPFFLLAMYEKAWTAPGKDRRQHPQSSCDPSQAASLPDQ